MTQFFLFDSTQSQKVLIWLNSWLSMALQELIQINSWLKTDFQNWIQNFKLTYYSKSFQNFDSNQLMTQKTFQNLDSNQLMTEWCYSFWVLYDLRGAFNFTVDLVWPFVGFPLNCWFHMTFSGLSTQVPFWWIGMNQLMAQGVSQRLESIHLSIWVAVQELTQNQLMAQVVLINSQVLIQIA